MARYYFPGVDPIGRRMDVGRGRTGGQIEIVGVAERCSIPGPADAGTSDGLSPHSSARRKSRTYLPSARRAIRSTGHNPPTREIQAIVPTMLTTDVKTLVRQRDETLVNERLLALLSACFGGLALLLAGIGVYGVVTYSVTQRTAELGLRIALGANRAGLLWLVIRGTLTLVIVAVVLGVTAAFMTSSLLSSFLFGIQPAEPWVYSATMALLVGDRAAGCGRTDAPRDAHRSGRHTPVAIEAISQMQGVFVDLVCRLQRRCQEDPARRAELAVRRRSRGSC